MSFHTDEEEDTDNDAGMLLNLSQKSNIFVADQTPTPTRLIKNCEEVGLFDDLRNVNPFDETFRRACEQSVQNSTCSQPNFHCNEDSLHTPQVFPLFDATLEGVIGAAGEDLTKQTLDTPGMLEVNAVESILDVTANTAKSKAEDFSNAPKYKPIAEKPAPESSISSGITFIPAAVQFLQPQLITVSFPTPAGQATNCSAALSVKSNEKSKPLLLPKLATCASSSAEPPMSSANSCTSTTSPTPHPEPSSASLTPTSQLPIKERLKAILSQSSKSKPPEWPDKSGSKNNNFENKPFGPKASNSCHKSTKDDTMERRRAASTRYRHKMRNEHKDLKKRNQELQTENEKLKQKIRHLEAEVAKLQSTALQPHMTDAALGVPAQIQIPASTIHLVMNIPKLVVPCGNDVNQNVLKHPLGYCIDKN